MAIVHRLPRPLWRLFSPVPNVVVVKVNGYEVGPGVILVNADLREANLEGVNLRKSVLSGATLAGADLHLAESRWNGEPVARPVVRGIREC